MKLLPLDGKWFQHATTMEFIMRLAGKTAFITGGNAGIGLATARLFVAEGAKVAITGRNAETLAEAKTELGDAALSFVADVLDDAAMAQALAATAAAFGPINAVFANAGIAGRTPIGDTPRSTFETVIATNLTGPFLTLQAALPYLADRASLILNGSVIASLGNAAQAAYAASKAGVRAMVRSLASDLAPRQIRVNVVVPGATDTNIWDAAAPTPEARAQLEAVLGGSNPLGRMLRAHEIANAALFLASDDASGVNAAEIVVDLGLTGAPAGAAAQRR
jgi:NAD(P)-dependent dehydrogenase (short-subunit alcohol dehydrogenase family)